MNDDFDIDIDRNFFSLGSILDTSNDEKFDSIKFNDMFDNSYCYDLKIFHLNVCSLPRKINSLSAYLSTLNQQFDILCLSETWLNEGRFIENFFPDYNKFYSKRPVNKAFGGGCAIFVRDSYHCTELSMLSCNLDHIECIFVEMSHLGKQVSIG